MVIFPDAFLCNVLYTSGSILLFSEKAWVYKGHFARLLRLLRSSMTWSAGFLGKRCSSLGFDSRRGFAWDMWLAIGFMRIGK